MNFPGGLSIAVLCLTLFLSSGPANAGSATWNLNPTSGDWNTANNWTPATVPNSPADTATFASSNTTAVSISAFTEVTSIVFNAGASAFTVTANPTLRLTISGAGIVNNSGIRQSLVTAVDGTGDMGTIFFTNSATAGSLIGFTNNGALNDAIGGEIDFFDSSSAGSATFTNHGGANGSFGGAVIFWNSSTAGDSTFINEGGTDQGSFGGITDFFDNASAGNATFIIDGGPGTFTQGGGEMNFQGNASADNATFIVNGGSGPGENGGHLQFFDSCSAGNAKLTANGGSGGGTGGLAIFFGDSEASNAEANIFGNGTLDVSAHDEPGMTIGSVQGTGEILLGSNTLSIGSNNLNTTFSGVIQDGGSLIKIGTGNLVLTNANTYTGGTDVEAGALVVNNRTGSGTGTGPVQIQAGTLAGRGIIAGAVTVGTLVGPGAVLSPGNSALKPRTLNIQGKLILNPDATYKVDLNVIHAMADKVVAKGITIRGALFSFNPRANGSLPPGTAFTVIDNTAASSIKGIFSNLADGEIIMANGNRFQASYEGGDGNDLVLTVVP